MSPNSLLLDKLSESLENFIDEYKLHYPNDKISSTWTVRDVLCHITYWHRYYVKNISAQVNGGKFLLPKIKFQVLNQKGVEKMRNFSDDKLFSMLFSAQKKMEEVILKNKVTKMTYREGSNPYDISRFIFIVNRHIGSHTRGIRKRRRVKTFIKRI